MLDASKTSPFATLWGRVPVEIGEVQARPARARRPIEVEAEAWLDKNDTDVQDLKSLTVFYSTDQGRNWQSAPLRPPGKSSRRWRGRLPPQEKGTRVIFYVEARDNLGQITREIPPLFSSAARAALVAEDADDSAAHPELVPPELDLLQTYAAYDDNYLYVGQAVKGNVEKGALEDPFAPCVYAVFVVNPDDPRIYDFSDAPALVYLPLGQMAGLPTSGLVQVNRLFGPRRAEALVPGAETKFEIQKDAGGAGAAQTLWFRLNRSALGANPSGRLRLVGVSMAFPDMRRPAPIPWDASPFATFYMRGHEVTVE